MMKIATVRKANLFRPRSTYALFRGEREIGQLTGDDNMVEIALEAQTPEGRTCRIERTRSGIATGALLAIVSAPQSWLLQSKCS